MKEVRSFVYESIINIRVDLNSGINDKLTKMLVGSIYFMTDDYVTQKTDSFSDCVHLKRGYGTN